MTDRWLLLLHQIPPKPPYFRAKVMRRLVQVGALPVKNSAYLLPDREDTLEDFEWICQEIAKERGGAWLYRAETIVGMSSDQIEEAFRAMRAPEYEELVQIAQAALDQQPFVPDDASAAHRRIAKSYEQLRSIDFFKCPARTQLEELMNELQQRAHPIPEIRSGLMRDGRVWVTRKGVKVDRIGSAWLVRRFINPQAAFRFVNPESYSHSEGENRFDMFEGEYTHQGDLCTFEVLVAAADLGERHPALRPMAEIIHDIDLKDQRFQRPETAGVAGLIKGLCLQHSEDEVRLERGAMIFDNLYESFIDEFRTARVAY
jgi:hypothetical protein